LYVYKANQEVLNTVGLAAVASGLGNMRDCPLDKTGRFSLPAEYRKELPEKLVIARSFGESYKYLKIYGSDDYLNWVKEYFKSIGGYNPAFKQHRDRRNFLHHKKCTVEVDGNGRLLIPKNLQEFAQLQPGKAVTVCGSDDHVQVWNPDTYAVYEAEMENLEFFVDEGSLVDAVQSSRLTPDATEDD
jgi:MraZ protein